MKMNRYSNKLQEIYDALDEFIGTLEEKRDAIEDKACEHDRDMTEREQERYDALDEQIDNVRLCMDDIESAMFNISEYCD